MKTKSKISGHIVRGSAVALFFVFVIVALSSAINLGNRPLNGPLPHNNTAFSVNGHDSAVSAAALPIRMERALTFADRVAYQRAIEEVYWKHRIWPAANAGPKPPLDKVMSQAEIEKKVEDYLRNSQALEDYWQRPITPDQLQAEMERIASHTKQPGVLREIFAALGNDPFVSTTPPPVSFAPPVFYSVPSGPTSVAVADFNGDGILDLAVVDEGGGSNPSGVRILLGNGDGTFQPAVLYSAGVEPSVVAVGDFNGDGIPDLVVTNYYYAGCPDGPCAYVSVLVGNGNGTFQSPVNTVLNSPGCLSPNLCGGGLSVVVGDFNHDGKLDIAVANPNTNGPNYYIEVLLGNGDGTFQPEVDYYMPQGPLSVRGINVGDFNGDGNLDLVFAVNGTNPGLLTPWAYC